MTTTGKGIRNPVKGPRLTDKMARFALEYLVDLNATDAAIRAGYSPTTAKWQGVKLKANPLVAEEIARLMEERADRTKIDADWVLKRLAEEADADVMDIYNEDMTLKPIKDWPKIWRQGLVAGVKVMEVGDAALIREVKLSDRVKRLELIGKHIDVGAFADKVKHEGEVTLTPVINFNGKGK